MNDDWTITTDTCPFCGHEAESGWREVAWVMNDPWEGGYETAVRTETYFHCLDPDCNYVDAEPATY